jgi:hypothetical protein
VHKASHESPLSPRESCFLFDERGADPGCERLNKLFFLHVTLLVLMPETLHFSCNEACDFASGFSCRFLHRSMRLCQRFLWSFLASKHATLPAVSLVVSCIEAKPLPSNPKSLHLQRTAYVKEGSVCLWGPTRLCRDSVEIPVPDTDVTVSLSHDQVIQSESR